jgi:methyl acetate hydrolase
VGKGSGNYMQHNILAPLGMHSTSFKLSPSQQERLAGMHTRQSDGTLSVIPFTIPQEPQFEMGGGGLYSTAPDYLRFTQMLLQGGTLNGKQILQPTTVQMMAQNHIGDLHCVELKTVAPARSHDANFFPGMVQKWGLSFLINTAQTPQGRSPGSLAWAGLANTFYWIDVTKRLTGVCVTQILPFFDPQALTLFRQYETAVYKVFQR